MWRRSLIWLLPAALAALALFSIYLWSEQPDPEATGDRAVVVLLHGLGRSSLSMMPLSAALGEQGYRVVNLDYPATRLSITELTAHLRDQIESCCAEDSRIHFVTHSLGGILLRHFLARHPIDSLGRVVMLSPPSGGSELVDHLGEYALFGQLLGPTAELLGTDSDSLPQQLEAVDFELGVITGDQSLNPLFSRLIPGPDDGKVSVESARTPGMADFLVVPYGHTFIMGREEVIDQTLHFLRHGRFSRPDSPGD